MKIAPNSLAGRVNTELKAHSHYLPQTVTDGGLTMGAFLGMIMAVRHPEWVAAVVEDMRRQGAETVPRGEQIADTFVKKIPTEVLHDESTD